MANCSTRCGYGRAVPEAAASTVCRTRADARPSRPAASRSRSSASSAAPSPKRRHSAQATRWLRTRPARPSRAEVGVDMVRVRARSGGPSRRSRRRLRRVVHKPQDFRVAPLIAERQAISSPVKPCAASRRARAARWAGPQGAVELLAADSRRRTEASVSSPGSSPDRPSKCRQRPATLRRRIGSGRGGQTVNSHALTCSGDDWRRSRALAQERFLDEVVRLIAVTRDREREREQVALVQVVHRGDRIRSLRRNADEILMHGLFLDGGRPALGRGPQTPYAMSAGLSQAGSLATRAFAACGKAPRTGVSAPSRGDTTGVCPEPEVRRTRSMRPQPGRSAGDGSGSPCAYRRVRPRARRARHGDYARFRLPRATTRSATTTAASPSTLRRPSGVATTTVPYGARRRRLLAHEVLVREVHVPRGRRPDARRPGQPAVPGQRRHADRRQRLRVPGREFPVP